MDGTTLALHLSLIRLAKGMLSAYEKWVRAKAKMAGLDPNKPAPVTMDEFVNAAIPEDVRRPYAASPQQQPELAQNHVALEAPRSAGLPRDSQGRPQ
jgi:hypothetical protein